MTSHAVLIAAVHCDIRGGRATVRSNDLSPTMAPHPQLKLPPTSLPLIDLSPYLDGSSSFPPTEAQKQCSAEIYKGCVEYGFFYLTGLGLAPEEMDRVISLHSRILCTASRREGEAQYRLPRYG
jgi:hypothetical protein